MELVRNDGVSFTALLVNINTICMHRTCQRRLHSTEEKWRAQSNEQYELSLH